MLQLVRPVLPNLPYLFLTFHLEYPSVLSRFCSLVSERLRDCNFEHRHNFSSGNHTKIASIRFGTEIGRLCGNVAAFKHTANINNVSFNDVVW